MPTATDPRFRREAHHASHWHALVLVRTLTPPKTTSCAVGVLRHCLLAGPETPNMMLCERDMWWGLEISKCC